jgi:hypothetical protein
MPEQSVPETKSGSIHKNPVHRHLSLTERFNLQHEAVTESGCWLWTGTTHKSGYGSIYMNGKNVRAHRAAYLLHIGKIPSGINVLHRCDVPSCVNPKHLFLGTHTDNMQDKVEKGRCNALIGIENPRAKISERDVIEIRRRHGERQTSLAKEFNVSQSSISNILNRDSWRHIV